VLAGGAYAERYLKNRQDLNRTPPQTGAPTSMGDPLPMIEAAIW